MCNTMGILKGGRGGGCMKIEMIIALAPPTPKKKNNNNKTRKKMKSTHALLLHIMSDER